MPEWTESQRNVIGSPERGILCSAAAGSGKTAVMIERIVRLIGEGADPFSFLVITFTNAAAAEMKEKIRTRLREGRKNPVLAAALEKAGAMEVCTIHAFCQHLIRQEFQTAGVDPLFQICTGAQREKLFEDAFRKACNALRKEEDEDYRTFASLYGPDEAREIVRQVWEFIRSLPDPLGWLLENTEGVPVNLDRDHPWFRTVSDMMEEDLMKLQVILRHQADMFDEYEKQEAYRAVWISDSEKVAAFRRWKEGQPVTREELTAPFMKAPALRNLNDREIDWKERYREHRDQLKKGCDKLASWIFIDEDQLKKEFREIRYALRGLRKITEKTDFEYMMNKAKACVLDFSDLEHKALAVLGEQDVLEAVRERYRLVFVDECQDVSTIQDTLIRTLSGERNALFMVGDVKQSIYRFRMANPSLFQKRIGDRSGNSGMHYVLQENFRSRPEILETVNTICRDIMPAADLDYGPGDELKPGLKDCSGHVPVMVDLLAPGEGQTPLEAIARHTAEEIWELRQNKLADYKDIVILMPEVSTDGPKLTEMLKRHGVPVFFDGKADFFEKREVEVFRSLLRIMDNPHQDLPLITVLVNTPFRFREEELAAVRLLHDGKKRPFWQAFEEACGDVTPLGRKCAAARKRLEDWRFLNGRIPLNDLLWYLLLDSGIYAVFGAAPQGRTAQKNLRSLCVQGDKAYARGMYSLREFLDFLSEQASGGEMNAPSALAEGENEVRIMTIHKSKGLQFPVVFCLDLEKGLTGKPGGAVRLDQDLGVCLRYKVAKWRLNRRTAADEIFAWKKERETRAEKTCLLYVAMTRAQQRLYMVGTAQSRTLWDMPPGRHRALAAADYLDWIVPPLLDDGKKSTNDSQALKPWKIRKIDCNQQESVETPKVIHSLLPWVESVLSAPPVDELWKTDSGEGSPAADENQLKKYSVSSLLQQARNRIFMDPEQTPEEKRTPDYVNRAMKRYQAARRPACLEQRPDADGAARGRAVHRFLSLVDLDAVRGPGGAEEASLDAILEALRADGAFTDVEAGWIRAGKISCFFASDIGRRMLASPEVHREWDFNLRVPDRGMLVQGIIDCAFREGDGWILLDYKTDRIEDEEAFLEEYRPQLKWYAKALEELTGLPVREQWLYALSVDKAFPV